MQTKEEIIKEMKEELKAGKNVTYNVARDRNSYSYLVLEGKKFFTGKSGYSGRSEVSFQQAKVLIDTRANELYHLQKQSNEIDDWLDS